VTQGTSDQASTALRLSVDSDLCAGHGRCFTVEPDLFDSDEAGYPVLRHDVVPPELVKKAENAVSNCPEGAISLSRPQ
jgi:ferredoxin